jgi:hypothetical protein
MRPSILTGQGVLHEPFTGLLPGQTSPALGSDPVHTSLPLLWCGRRPVVGHHAAWPRAFASTRPLSSPRSFPLSSALR